MSSVLHVASAHQRWFEFHFGTRGSEVLPEKVIFNIKESKYIFRKQLFSLFFSFLPDCGGLSRWRPSGRSDLSQNFKYRSQALGLCCIGSCTGAGFSDQKTSKINVGRPRLLIQCRPTLWWAYTSDGPQIHGARETQLLSVVCKQLAARQCRVSRTESPKGRLVERVLTPGSYLAPTDLENRRCPLFHRTVLAIKCPDAFLRRR